MERSANLNPGTVCRRALYVAFIRHHAMPVAVLAQSGRSPISAVRVILLQSMCKTLTTKEIPQWGSKAYTVFTALDPLRSLSNIHVKNTETTSRGN